MQSSGALRARISRERKTKTSTPPPHLYRQFIVERRLKTLFPIYDISPKSEAPHSCRILYLHGGNFLFDINSFHWAFVAAMAERLNAVVTVPIYPLGPEVTLYEMYDMVQPLHDEMASCLDDDTPIFTVGDSAGACMALVLTQRALAEGGVASTRLVLTTPVVDSSLTNPETRRMAGADPWLGIPGIEETLRLACPGSNPKDPVISPLYGDMTDLPPTMVLTAEYDLLSPDTRRFVKKARAHGCDIEHVEGPGMIHAWPILPFHEGYEAREAIFQWLEDACIEDASYMSYD